MESSRRRTLLLGCLAVLAPIAAGCGGAAGTITVGGATPVYAPPAAVPVSAVDSVPVGPGPVSTHLVRGAYGLTIRIAPNRASGPNRISVSVTRSGVPVAGARVRLAAGMLTMDMGTAHYTLGGGGTYAVRTPAWVMPGRWGLAFSVRAPGAAGVQVALDDRMRN